jgi:hypothetical protein
LNLAVYQQGKGQIKVEVSSPHGQPLPEIHFLQFATIRTRVICENGQFDALELKVPIEGQQPGLAVPRGHHPRVDLDRLDKDNLHIRDPWYDAHPEAWVEGGGDRPRWMVDAPGSKASSKEILGYFNKHILHEKGSWDYEGLKNEALGSGLGNVVAIRHEWTFDTYAVRRATADWQVWQAAGHVRWEAFQEWRDGRVAHLEIEPIDQARVGPMSILPHEHWDALRRHYPDFRIVHDAPEPDPTLQPFTGTALHDLLTPNDVHRGKQPGYSWTGVPQGSPDYSVLAHDKASSGAGSLHKGKSATSAEHDHTGKTVSRFNQPQILEPNGVGMPTPKSVVPPPKPLHDDAPQMLPQHHDPTTVSLPTGEASVGSKGSHGPVRPHRINHYDSSRPHFKTDTASVFAFINGHWYRGEMTILPGGEVRLDPSAVHIGSLTNQRFVVHDGDAHWFNVHILHGRDGASHMHVTPITNSAVPDWLEVLDAPTLSPLPQIHLPGYDPSSPDYDPAQGWPLSYKPSGPGGVSNSDYGPTVWADSEPAAPPGSDFGGSATVWADSEPAAPPGSDFGGSATAWADSHPTAPPAASAGGGGPSDDDLMPPPDWQHPQMS